MNLITILFMWVALSVEVKDKVLLLKCKMPLCEKTLEMFEDSAFFRDVFITYMDDDFHFIEYEICDKSEFLFIQENQMFYISLGVKISQKILEGSKYYGYQGYLKLRFYFDSTRYKVKNKLS